MSDTQNLTTQIQPTQKAARLICHVMGQNLMKRNFKYFFAVIIFSIVAIYFFQKDDDVKISNITWAYDNSTCFVSFKIINNSHNALLRNVRITAHWQRNIGKGAVVNDIIGSWGRAMASD